MRNPNAMREAMRSQDLAMSQIENLPGGFNALRRMFEEVQEPMMEAAATSGIPSTPSSSAPSNNSTTNTTTPTNSAVPNPWGTNPNVNNVPTNPFAGFGGMDNNPFLNGGMNGFGMEQQDPAQMAQMMNNPMMQQMMTQMFSDPAMLDQVLLFFESSVLFALMFLFIVLQDGCNESTTSSCFTKSSNARHDE